MDTADGPCSADVIVGVASVQLIPVVEPEGVCQGLVGRRRPQQELLGPVHPQVAVEIPIFRQVALRGIPERVVGGSLVQLGQRVRVRLGILGVAGECLPRPCGEPSYAVIVRVVKAPVVCQLAPHDQLLEKGLEGISRCVRALCFEGDALCADLAEVQPR